MKANGSLRWFLAASASVLLALGLASGCGDETGGTGSEGTGAGAGTGTTSSGTGTAGGGTGAAGGGGSGGGGDCSASCDACKGCAVEGACAAAVASCSANPECGELSGCVAVCGQTTECVATCAAQHPVGIGDYKALATCVLCDQCPSCTGCDTMGCIDGMKNGAETAADCGGTECAGCADGNPCAVDGDCAAGHCVEGLCCDTACDGACQACSAAKTGGVDGTCGGLPSGSDPDDECAGADVCSGTGACQCDDGVTNGAETGTDCGGPTCPDCGDGEPCSSGGDCQSGFCVDGVCCDTDCSGSCLSCSAAKKGGGQDGVCGPVASDTDPDADCTSPAADVCNGAGECRCFDGVQNGGETGTDCGGSCAPCGGNCMDNVQNNGETDIDCGGPTCPDCANGKKCVAGGDCQSASCADGVCCNSACAGTCQACTNAKTGLANGTCGPIPNGGDPDAECADQGAGSCGTDGACNGASACRLYAAGQPCGTPLSCSVATQTNADACNGSGVCTDNGTTPCPPYVCGPVSCKTSCGNDVDCSAGNYCAAPNCVAKKANGQACGGANQCVSGSCVDGVCCNSACGGLCQACSAAKTGVANGTCAAVPNGADPDSECADQGGPSCGTDGSCNGAGACRLYASGTFCGTPLSCSVVTQTNQDTCNGAGTCVDNGTTSCPPYVCGPVSCKLSCGADGDCVSSHYCAAPTCVVKKPNGQACAGGNQCQSGNCFGGICCNEPTCGPNATCGGGGCNCVGSWLDCDGSWGTGCEVNGSNSSSNCGGCGIPCQGSRYECCGGVCHDMCNPPECNACGFGCSGSEQCFANSCGNACP